MAVADRFTIDQRGAAVITRAEVAELRERFMRFVRVDGDAGCWIWHGALNEHGYGRFTYGPGGRIKRYAHRVAVAIFLEDVPGDREVDHRCRRRSCVNPEHLQLLTDAANRARRGDSPEIGPVAQSPFAGFGAPVAAAEIPY